MARSDNEVIVGIEPVTMIKNFVQPVTIEKDFVSYVAFKHVRVEKIVKKGKKEVSEKVMDRYPLMLIYNGKDLKYTVCERKQDIEINGKHYLIDRDIDDSPTLPDEAFVNQLLDSKTFKNLMLTFEAKKLFDEVLNYFEYYFHMERPYLYKIVSLFAINQWVFDAHESTPYLFIRSPVKGCAKTNLGMSISQMANGELMANMKAHHVFRAVHTTKKVIAFDEIKKWSEAGYKSSDDTKDTLSLVNVGFQKGGSKVPRLQDAGKKGERTVLYDSFSPKIMITTSGTLPDDTASRCIKIIMQKAPPASADYGERWYNPDRIKHLKRIREMGLLFRLKYGMDIYEMSRNQHWREELDMTGVLKGVKNRDLQIFRPLVMLCLMYKPEWKDEIGRYIHKFIENESKNEYLGPINNVLHALRDIFTDVTTSSYHSYEDENGSVSIEDDPIQGHIMTVPVKAIVSKIEQQTDLDVLGKRPGVKVGYLLQELGFTSGKKRTRDGIVRVIKVKELADRCERYIGMGLGKEHDDRELSQAERIDLVRETLLTHSEGLTFDEIHAEVLGRIEEKSLKSILKQQCMMGYVEQRGKKFVWV